MSETIIHIEDLGKRYCIGERERYLALRDVLARAEPVVGVDTMEKAKLGDLQPLYSQRWRKAMER